MAETVTVNYGWTKPDPGASANTWGQTLNSTIDKIDAQAFTATQGGVPIGSISMFGGATPPANWLICDGTSYSTAAPYDKLFAVLQYAFGGSGANFNVPKLQGTFALGAGPSNALASAGGTFSYTIATANLPSHAHPIADVAHNHGVNQWGHAHAIATGGHSHNVTAHAHGASLVRQGAGSATLASGGPIQIASFGNTDAAASTTDAAGNLGGNTDTQTSAISINASGTNLSTTQAVGSGAAMSIVPSYVALSFIIKYA